MPKSPQFTPMLLTDADKAFIFKLHSRLKQDGKIPFKLKKMTDYKEDEFAGQTFERSLIFTENDIYVLFDKNKNLLESGHENEAFYRIKLAQNMVTNEWAALQIIATPTQSRTTESALVERYVKVEVDVLERAKLLKSYLPNLTKTETLSKSYILSDILGQKNLRNYLYNDAYQAKSQFSSEQSTNTKALFLKKNQIPFDEALNIAISLINNMNDLHNDNILIRNFTLQDIIVDVNNHNASFYKFKKGLAIKDENIHKSHLVTERKLIDKQDYPPEFNQLESLTPSLSPAFYSHFGIDKNTLPEINLNPFPLISFNEFELEGQELAQFWDTETVYDEVRLKRNYCEYTLRHCEYEAFFPVFYNTLKDKAVGHNNEDVLLIQKASQLTLDFVEKRFQKARPSYQESTLSLGDYEDIFIENLKSVQISQNDLSKSIKGSKYRTDITNKLKTTANNMIYIDTLVEGTPFSKHSDIFLLGRVLARIFSPTDYEYPRESSQMLTQFKTYLQPENNTLLYEQYQVWDVIRQMLKNIPEERIELTEALARLKRVQTTLTDQGEAIVFRDNLLKLKNHFHNYHKIHVHNPIKSIFSFKLNHIEHENKQFHPTAFKGMIAERALVAMEALNPQVDVTIPENALIAALETLNDLFILNETSFPKEPHAKRRKDGLYAYLGEGINLIKSELIRQGVNIPDLPFEPASKPALIRKNGNN